MSDLKDRMELLKKKYKIKISPEEIELDAAYPVSQFDIIDLVSILIENKKMVVFTNKSTVKTINNWDDVWTMFDSINHVELKKLKFHKSNENCKDIYCFDLLYDSFLKLEKNVNHYEKLFKSLSITIIHNDGGNFVPPFKYRCLELLVLISNSTDSNNVFRWFGIFLM